MKRVLEFLRADLERGAEVYHEDGEAAFRAFVAPEARAERLLNTCEVRVRTNLADGQRLVEVVGEEFDLWAIGPNSETAYAALKVCAQKAIAQAAEQFAREFSQRMGNAVAQQAFSKAAEQFVRKFGRQGAADV